MPDNPYGIPGLAVWASVLDDGTFQIEGQHLGVGQKLVGRDDYEYFHRVPPAAVPALAAALGVEPSDVLTGWAEHEVEIVRHGEQRWLKEHGIEHVTRVI